jgi:tetratricopeptide (TPR) repeat protein
VPAIGVDKPLLWLKDLRLWASILPSHAAGALKCSLAWPQEWKAFTLKLDPKPEDATDHFLVANSHSGAGNWDLAIAAYKQALAAAPSLPGVRLQLGYCCKKRGL